MSEVANPLEQLLRFLADLDEDKQSYRLLSQDPVTTVVQVALPRARWRLEFHQDGRVSFRHFAGQDVQSGLGDFLLVALDDAARERASNRMQRLSPFEQQLAFMRILSEAGTHASLACHRNALMFEVDLGDEFWEIEFFGDGSIDSDQFVVTDGAANGGLRQFWAAANGTS